MDIQNTWIGTWKLISCVTIDDEGKEMPFFGNSPTGVLMYTKDGHMAAQFMPQDRPSFSSSDWNKVSEKEAWDALMTYQAYYGTYKVSEDKGFVTHFVQGGIRPNWKGLEEIRYFQFDEKLLTLTSPPIQVGGKALIFKAKWTKAV